VLFKILHLFARFSISDFIPRPKSVNSLAVPAHPAGLRKQGVGLAIISCSRKSSFLPSRRLPAKANENAGYACAAGDLFLPRATPSTSGRFRRPGPDDDPIPVEQGGDGC